MPALTEQQILQRVIELEREMDDKWIGFKWSDIPASPATLNKMVIDRVLYISYDSANWTHYRLAIPIKEAEKLLLGPESPLETEEEPTEIPDDLFNLIVGHDRAKRIINRCLVAEKPVHVLLSGPPATAKSQFVMEISRLPNSRYALGSTSSKAGIVDFLLEQRPRYLIVDELGRMSAEDQSALLSLMETGIVTRLKKGMREKAKLDTLVLATCNRLERLSPELRSRFWILHFRDYSPDEFRRVVVGVLTNREGTSPELADYIAERMVSEGLKDVRDSVRLARLAKTRGEVDEFLAVMIRKQEGEELGAESGSVIYQ